MPSHERQQIPASRKPALSKAEVVLIVVLTAVAITLAIPRLKHTYLYTFFSVCLEDMQRPECDMIPVPSGGIRSYRLDLF